ncbi:MAG: asparagine synthase (glutamine-hydrolyzing) [Polyangiaceae bacterium]|nr:asparagine synthase (glutamine-hydrolyzing) [Polyangiaceae bacterium]
MCGILGAYSARQPFATPPFPADSLHVMRHRGPDAQGWYFDDHAVLGFRRLAILDLAGGGQPLYSEDEQIVAVVNGEIYNHHALREELKERHRFRTRVDGEVLIHLYEEKGLDFVKELSGMFGFALYDRTKRRLILGRDRPGLKPLYYEQRDGVLRFASELKPLVLGRTPKISSEAVADYLRFGYIPAPLTIFDGIKKLASGSILVIEKDGEPRIENYWKLQFDHDATKPDASWRSGQWEEELRETLRTAVHARLESEVPMGFLLSGGVDSASVFALGAKALEGREVQAFTIGFQGDPIDETQAAGEVAHRYGATHRVMHLGRKDARTLDDVLYYVEEPVSTDALLPTASVFRAVAGAHVTTVLSGEGSDELFAGYKKFARTVQDGTAESLRPLERYLRHEEFVFSSSAERQALLGEDIATDRFADLEREAEQLDPLSQMLLFEQRLRLPDRINLRLDRTSMAHSIEARAPFMDHKVIEFAARIPHSLRTGPKFNKYLLRRAMRNDLPPVVIEARKSPFHAPAAWFTNAAETDTLLQPRAIADAGMVKPEPVQALREKAAQGDTMAQEKVFSLLVLHAWHRAFYRRLQNSH